jgi:hypothetical protein
METNMNNTTDKNPDYSSITLDGVRKAMEEYFWKNPPPLWVEFIDDNAIIRGDGVFIITTKETYLNLLAKALDNYAEEGEYEGPGLQEQLENMNHASINKEKSP